MLFNATNETINVRTKSGAVLCLRASEQPARVVYADQTVTLPELPIRVVNSAPSRIDLPEIPTWGVVIVSKEVALAAYAMGISVPVMVYVDPESVSVGEDGLPVFEKLIRA